MSDQDLDDDDLAEGNENDIAIVGMASHLPDAPDYRRFWANLRAGRCSSRFYTDAELEAEGVPPELLSNPNYVKAGTPLQDMEYFDGDFFGFSPKESGIMDPQHRHFIECAWEALEDAGHPPEKFEGPIGVFAGCGMGAYFVFNLLTNPELVDNVGLFLLRHTGNDKDFLATRVSYVLNLTGPSVNVQTACSTSLVATHLACQSLLAGECDMALAGGSTVEVPHRHGYMYHEGEVLSPDGHCHAFDYRGKGTVFGSGTGAVCLRRLADAIADGDPIHAIIKGSAINNDGAGKVGYLAPSVDGQAGAMAEALAVSGVDADTVTYVEAHGTGTYMGDPIEVSALTQAFREHTERTQYCGLGSAKTNIGHLDTAAGVASLVKATLALKHRELPASLNFEKPNPTIDFENSPFYVNHSLKEWEVPAGTPRRAGINSLGVGGTNAFMVLEESTHEAPSSEPTRPWQLLTLSGRNGKALDENAARLADHLEAHPEQRLADVAYTLMAGRRSFEKRRVLAARDRDDAIRLLREGDKQRVLSHTVSEGKGGLVFMFPGGGSQYPRMGYDLYESEPVFRRHIDAGLAAAKKHGVDLRAHLYCAPEELEAAGAELRRTEVQLPAVFITCYALAQLWISKGVEPAALIGHSLGENTAAAVAGVLSFEDAVGLTALRGRLFEKCAEGGMLSVALPAAEAEQYVSDELTLGVINSPGLCVISGPAAEVAALEQRLAAEEVEVRRIRINRAAHCGMLDPVLDEFRAYLRKIELKAPQIPFVSNRTGTWITEEQARDPEYWVRHLRETVRYSECMETLLEETGRTFLEVGPGKTLGSLARQQPRTSKDGHSVLNSLRHRDQRISDAGFFWTVYGQLWAAAGRELDRDVLWPDEQRRKLFLPTYAFQRQRFWYEPGKSFMASERTSLTKLQDLEDWFYEPTWRQRLPGDLKTSETPAGWLVFLDQAGLGKRVVERLRARGEQVIVVREADGYYQFSETDYSLNPEEGGIGYEQLVRDLLAAGTIPQRIVHLWLVTADENARPGSSFFHRNMERGFYGLFFLAQAFTSENVQARVHVTCVTNGMQSVKGEDLAYPAKATVLGPLKVIPRELQNVTCSCVDVVLPEAPELPVELPFDIPFLGYGQAAKELDELAEQLVEVDLLGAPENAVAAYREGKRYALRYVRRPFEEVEAKLGGRLKKHGVYLITGGLGGLGLLFADFLARRYQAKLVLQGRTPLPPRDEWEAWLVERGLGNPVSRKIIKVRELEERGAEVFPCSADVADVMAMRELIAGARRRFGRIQGLFHAAGVVKDDLIAMKSQRDCEEVFTAKLHGTQILDDLFREEPLELMVLFSSTSAVTGPPGQVDYVAANAYMNAFAQKRAGDPQTRIVAVNWGIWNEVGMAVTLAEEMGGGGALIEEAAKHPLFDVRISSSGGGSFLVQGDWQAEAQWALDEHRTKNGHALIPGTGYLELARAARAEHGETSPFEIRDLFFLRPLHVADDETRTIRVRLRRQQEEFTFEAQSQYVLPDERVGWATHAQARLLPGARLREERIDVAAIDARCQVSRSEVDPRGMKSAQDHHLRFGKRWKVLNQVLVGEGEALARLSLREEYVETDADYGLHPALVDIGTGFAMDLIEGYGGQDLWVPISYKVVRVRGGLPPRIVSWVRLRGETRVTADVASFDVVLADESGEVRVEIEEFSIKRMSGETDFALAAAPAANELELEQGSGARQLSPAELTFQHNLSQGIDPANGVEALDRILAGRGTPTQVVVSSMDLDGLLLQTDELAQAAVPDTSTKFARPELDSEYEAPANDIEETLVGFWEELLGVDKVGVGDSFFDLGGHSLIAVRLFAKIKKAYSVDYPISLLFEAPTIRDCAKLIQMNIGDAGKESGTAATPKAQERRYKHLVVMHPGDPGPKTPFFLVAGMFGNVLNLRNLANLLGTTRPFYGLQAKGIYGEEQPHETFEEMARDYIAEMRTVQPHGPYLLGGFSGGGITAYEIAQQLRAAGEEVGCLIMLDTALPQREKITLAEKATIKWNKFKELGPAGFLSYWARGRLHWYSRELQFNRIRKEMEDESKRPLSPTELHNSQMEAAFEHSLQLYRLQSYEGDVILFRPRQHKVHVLGPNRATNAAQELLLEDNGWGQHVRSISIYEMPGNHDSMVLEPNVRVLARYMNERIEEAEGAAAPPSEPVASGA